MGDHKILDYFSSVRKKSKGREDRQQDRQHGYHRQ
ncbi:Uncharacterised protein [Vibrio cholerae]|uniref:Uncharacterized protein n=1 Tax=Vibrio cholerae TaxID=666 RepID=A0A655XB27_VIBCL|nr:Uncharacterised protein [Vibrio cholerae]CSB96169.1 Uncharacterised protein [Vibrio cholerae]CSB98703.1 Uncharacterised protein [Vibrio cholerae]CSC05262.1 Uncharacterised protein [Vibrio cholerae]CSC08256.1 Uncharacterised protein [Vibrio cholerae]